MTRPLRFVALGDSYTIGTALPEAADRWPNRLAAALDAARDAARDRSQGAAPEIALGAGLAPATLELVANLAVEGFTSRDVIDVELPDLPAVQPGFASLLVGVNDVVQGVPAATYRANAARILDVLLGRLPPNRIVTVGTPDYTVTPRGASYGDPTTQSAGIRTNNAILGELAAERRVAFVDIFDLSLRAAGDRTLVAGDDLHPSGAQYSLWVERIGPVVARLLAS